jgi:DNA-binding MarR family transcriptional regulator
MAAAQDAKEVLMSKLTDTQLVILSAAGQRDNGTVLPLPKSLKLQGAAVTRVLKSLLKNGLLEEQPAGNTAVAWRDSKDGQRLTLVITDAGRQAIGLAADQQNAPPPESIAPRGSKRSADGGRKASKSKGTAAPGSKEKRTPSPVALRAGTKLALLLDLLQRKGGATIAEVTKATGWQAHSVRGAISGALKKKLGLAVASDKVEGRGRVYRIAAKG